MNYELRKDENGKVKLVNSRSNKTYSQFTIDFYEASVESSFINEETSFIITDYNERKLINTGITLLNIFKYLYN